MPDFYSVSDYVENAAASAAAAAASAAAAGIALSGFIGIGDQNTDGSWRFRASGGALLFEVRVGGTWEERDQINQ